jgi:EAL domain-containing protein (putative c-di-GMP-specific phosphodiesterase class I)
MVYPDSFVPFAERSDLIIDLDRWVIARVARQMGEWSETGALAALPVSINISGRHLAFDSFVESVLGPLREYDVDPSRIVIEITESALLDDLGAARVKLQELRDQGIRVAIDDFGTGYTSLAHLRTLPIDVLKIDRSFTADAGLESLVKLIIDTGHLLGVTITAEGIETEDQASKLRLLGSDELQGYYFGRPCPADQLTALLVPQHRPR